MKQIKNIKKICEECKSYFLTDNRTSTILCSMICRKLRARKRKGMSSHIGIAPGTVGAIQELRVSIDLLLKNYSVFRALSPSCESDLAILKNKKLVTIEVRTGYKGDAMKVTYIKKNIKADVIAVVLPDEIIYIPELPI